MNGETENKEKRHTPWHAGFRNALETTLDQYRDLLEFKFEYQLTAEALRPDAIIIKKDRDVVIDHDIGGFFKIWNIIEYKGPEDFFSVPDIHKMLGYMHIYMATHPDAVREEGTLTIIRTGESKSVLRYLEKQGYEIKKRFNEAGEAWAYEVECYGIAIRIIQSERLPDSGNMLLRHLRKGLDTSTLKKVLEDGEVYRKLGMLEAYLQVLLEANEEQFKEVTAMINSPIIERVLEESGWAQRVRDREKAFWEQEKVRVEQEKARVEQEWERDRQIWADKLREVEADRQKSEADRQKVEADRQKSEAERQKVEAEREAERQKSEAEKAELREKVLFLEQSLKEQAAQHRAE
jgi:chemotaxis protein histidine kinase CheA